MKAVIVTIIWLWASVSLAHNQNYYRLHPHILQEAIKQCPENIDNDTSCLQLRQVALHVNSLVDELRSGPQYFGKKILDLQQLIAKQEMVLQLEGHQTVTSLELAKNRQQLAERLAIVKWLESPES
ncbi:MAG: hypothetical protein ACOVQX_01280 [Legionella sp.]